MLPLVAFGSFEWSGPCAPAPWRAAGVWHVPGRSGGPQATFLISSGPHAARPMAGTAPVLQSPGIPRTSAPPTP